MSKHAVQNGNLDKTGETGRRPVEKSAEGFDPALLGIGIGGLGGAIGGAASAPTGRGFEGATRGAAQGLGAIAGLGLGAAGGAMLGRRFGEFGVVA